MIRAILISVLFFGIFSSAIAQPKIVGFKKLQLFLPGIELPGFERNKPTGRTQTVMGMTTSEASVEYASKSTGNENDTVPHIQIQIRIQDVTFMPYVLVAFSMMQQGNESETESGYEKAVSVKTVYPGKITAQTGEYKNCKIEFGVANRFLVQLEASNTSDPLILNKLIDKMDLENLAKVEADK